MTIVNVICVCLPDTREELNDSQDLFRSSSSAPGRIVFIQNILFYAGHSDDRFVRRPEPLHSNLLLFRVT